MNFKKHAKRKLEVLILLQLLFSNIVIASSHLPIHKNGNTYKDRSKNNSRESIDIEKGFFHSVDIIETDTETGIDQATYNTRDDDHRYSLGFLLNANPMKLTKVIGGELTYGFKFTTGAHFEIFASMVNANLEIVSDHDNASGLSGSLISGGLGFGLRSSLIQHFIDSKTFFETISGYLSYNQLSSPSINGPFVGPGIKAVYGLHQRVGKTIHYGLKVAYDLASVRRPALTEVETTGDRALILTSLTFGLDLTLYY